MPERELAALASGQLVTLVAERSPDADRAWQLLVERHARLVWKVVRCLNLPEEASWEAYQSTWLRAIERLDSLRDPACFPGWLATIAKREAGSIRRARAKLVPSDILEEQAADEPPVSDRLQRDETGRAVREGFASLPTPCQDLLRLLTAEPPVPYREIEQLLDMAHGSIGPTRRRCLDKLRNTAAMVAFFEDVR